MRETQWKIYLANSSDPTQNLADLTGATNIKVSVGLNKSGNVSVTIPLISEAASIVEPITTCLVLYAHGEAASNVAVWSGPVWTLEESAQNNTLSINAVGWFELLNHRIIEDTVLLRTPQTFSFMNPTATSNASYWDAWSNTVGLAATLTRTTTDFDSSSGAIQALATGGSKSVRMWGIASTLNFYYDTIYTVSGRMKLRGSMSASGTFPSGVVSFSAPQLKIRLGTSYINSEVDLTTSATTFINQFNTFTISWLPSQYYWNVLDADDPTHSIPEVNLPPTYGSALQEDYIASQPKQTRLSAPGAGGFTPDVQADGWYENFYNGHKYLTPFWPSPVELGVDWVAGAGATVSVIIDSLTASVFQTQPPYAAFSSVDAGSIVNSLMGFVNQSFPLGITTNTVQTTVPRTRSYKRWDNLGRAIQELSDAESGFDWTMDPLTKKLNIWQRLGVTQEDVVFGFRAGPSNLRDASRKTDSSILANHVLVAGKFGIFSDEDTLSASVYGRFDDYISLQEVADPEILDAYSSIEVAFRSQPRELHTFNPYSPNETFRVPRLHRDYWLGDIVFFSANYGRMQVDRQPVRIYEVSFTIDSEGNEKIDSLGTSADSSA